MFKLNTIYHDQVWTLCKKVEAGVVEARCRQQSMSGSVAEQGSVRGRSYLNGPLCFPKFQVQDFSELLFMKL